MFCVWTKCSEYQDKNGKFGNPQRPWMSLCTQNMVDSTLRYYYLIFWEEYPSIPVHFKLLSAYPLVLVDWQIEVFISFFSFHHCACLSVGIGCIYQYMSLCMRYNPHFKGI